MHSGIRAYRADSNRAALDWSQCKSAFWRNWLRISAQSKL